MRKLLFLPVLLISAVAFGQVAVQSGHAGNWRPGVYAGPFSPLVVTPSVSLGQYSPSSVGATNATAGNEAGARNSTLSIPTPLNGAVVPQATWYGAAMPASQIVSTHHSHFERASQFEAGSAESEGGIGVATLMSEGFGGPAHVKASRVYTNQDVDAARQQVEQNVGTVKYGGKVEHLQ